MAYLFLGGDPKDPKNWAPAPTPKPQTPSEKSEADVQAIVKGREQLRPKPQAVGQAPGITAGAAKSNLPELPRQFFPDTEIHLPERPSADRVGPRQAYEPDYIQSYTPPDPTKLSTYMQPYPGLKQEPAPKESILAEKESTADWLRRWATQPEPSETYSSDWAVWWLREGMMIFPKGVADVMDRFSGKLKGDPTPDEVLMALAFAPFGRSPGIARGMPALRQADLAKTAKNVGEVQRPPAPGPKPPAFRLKREFQPTTEAPEDEAKSGLPVPEPPVRGPFQPQGPALGVSEVLPPGELSEKEIREAEDTANRDWIKDALENAEQIVKAAAHDAGITLNKEQIGIAIKARKDGATWEDAINQAARASSSGASAPQRYKLVTEKVLKKGQLESTGPKRRAPERVPGPFEAQPQTPGSRPQEGADLLARKIEDQAMQLKGREIARRTEVAQGAAQIPPEMKVPEFRERVTRSVTNPQADPEAYTYYERYIRPMVIKGMIYYRNIKGWKWPISPDGFIHRVRMDMGHPFDRTMYPEEDPITNIPRVASATLSKQAPGLKRSVYYVLEGAGKRILIRTGKAAKAFRVLGGDGVPEIPMFFRARNLTTLPYRFFKMEAAKAREKAPTKLAPGVKWFDEGGWFDAENQPRMYTVRRATNEEIEGRTDLKFFDDAYAVSADNYLRLARVHDNAQFLERLKADPTFQLFTTTDLGTANKNGWMHPDVPQFRNVFMPPKVAQAINTAFRGALVDNEPTNAMQSIAGILVKSMFYTPIPHLANVAAHWFVGRAWDMWTPTGMAAAFKYGKKAIHDVLSLSPDYLAVIREGGGLWYGATAMRGFNDLMLKMLGHELIRDEGIWAPILKDFGFLNPAEAVKALYRSANKALWAGSDIMLLMRVYELQAKGLSLQEAVHEAERFIPNYRIPTQVLGSRAVAEILRRPNWTIFGRYHYGLFRAFGETFKDLFNKDPEFWHRNLDAIGHVFNLMVGAFVVYPLVDKIIEANLEQSHAGFRRSGPFRLLEGIHDVAVGRQGAFVSLMGSIFTMAPLYPVFTELEYNKDPFTGQAIVSPYSRHKGLEVMGQALQLMPPFQQIQQGLQGARKPQELLLQQALIDTQKYKPRHLPRSISRRETRRVSRKDAKLKKEFESLGLGWLMKELGL